VRNLDLGRRTSPDEDTVGKLHGDGRDFKVEGFLVVINLKKQRRSRDDVVKFPVVWVSSHV
jgi:hypothetical protein